MKLDAKSIIATAVGIFVLYATVYYGGKAWKRSQTGEKLV